MSHRWNNFLPYKQKKNIFCLDIKTSYSRKSNTLYVYSLVHAREASKVKINDGTCDDEIQSQQRRILLSSSFALFSKSLCCGLLIPHVVLFKGYAGEATDHFAGVFMQVTRRCSAKVIVCPKKEELTSFFFSLQIM